MKNVDATVQINGEDYHHKAALNKEDIKRVEETANNLYASVPLLSEDRWGINCIDVVSSAVVVDKLVRRREGEDGYKLDLKSDPVKSVLDYYIDRAEKESGKKYDQLIVISPIAEVAINWFGCSGGEYRGVKLIQVNIKSGYDWHVLGRDFPECVFLHEMLHTNEHKSIDLYDTQASYLNLTDKGPSIYAEANGGVEVYWKGQNGWENFGAFFSDLMCRNTPDKNCIDERAYYTDRNRVFKVVYGSEYLYPKTDVSRLTISKIKNYAYTGKAIKPKLTVKDGKKTLTEGKDYALTYLNNTDVGYAAVIISGKGAYSGKTSRNFKIVPKKNKLTVRKTGNDYTFSWQGNNGAKAFELYVSENGGKSYELLKTVYGDVTAADITIKSSKSLKFKMRSLSEIYPQKFYSSYTSEVTAKRLPARKSMTTNQRSLLSPASFILSDARTAVLRLI